MKKSLAIGVTALLVTAVGLYTYDRSEQERNKHLCFDLVRFIAKLREIEKDANDSSTNAQVDAFASREHVADASRILDTWKADSDRKRGAVCRDIARALGHYRRVTEVYMEIATDPHGEGLPEFGVKFGAGRAALLDAAGSAVGMNGLRLSAARRAELRTFVNTVFASETRDLDANRGNPSFKANDDIWAIELLRGALVDPRPGA